jgi:acyl transferase domain-containing protein/NADPH:quinone reductase-like Zn-dependent oxidoreductase/NADP-dependent 3-hydroxy acid dehydrogenase YdfG/acyl carrier protein
MVSNLYSSFEERRQIMKKAKIQKSKSINKEPLVIIGIGCRFPGNANTPEEFWNLLANKIDAIADIPSDRWDKDAYYDPDISVSGKISVRKGGFIKDIDKFDNLFFGISPVEATQMDPQHRILLEVVYEAFEDGGIRIEDISGESIGVYMGMGSHDFGEIRATPEEHANIGPNSNTGSACSVAAGRISYTFNLKGPCFAVDTACSSSLTAVHLACRRLWESDDNMAIAGGINLILRPELTMGFSRGGFLSPDEKCKAFDASANGYVRSEGAGIVIIKKLSQAIKDNNKIYAQIIGSAINQDGKTMGIALPNYSSQIELLKSAYKDAGISPLQVKYVEAHGTGTQAGDSIEARALGEVIGKGRKKGNPCLIGSVKTNIGHLEFGAAAAGLIKICLSLKNNLIPPNLHFHTPNPEIPFDELGIKVVGTETKLKFGNKGIYLGLNSFGFGGSNAHLVLKSPPVKAVKPCSENNREDAIKLFSISTRDENSLKSLASKYLDSIKESPEKLKDLCFSAINNRSNFEFRLAVPYYDRNELIDKLDCYIKNGELPGGYVSNISETKNKTVFVFSGQGPQWWAMGRELLKKEPVFKNAIEKVNDALKNIGWLNKENSSLLEELMKTEADSGIDKTRIAQPAIFGIQVALYELWKYFGVTPDAIVGHSIGEVAAAYSAGVLSLEEASRIVYWRSECQASLEGKGKILAVTITENQIKNNFLHATDRLDVATINGPNSLTVAGEEDELDTLSLQLTKNSIYNKYLKVHIPFHCRLMDSIQDIFIESLGRVEYKDPQIPLYSTVTGKQEKKGIHCENYWYDNIRKPVLFYQSIKEIIKDGYTTFIELSPHPILSRGIEDTLTEMKKKGTTLPSLIRERDEQPVFYGSLASLLTKGYPVYIHKLFTGEEVTIDLPRYPWQKDSLWVETEQSKNKRKGIRIHPHLGEEVRSADDPDTIIWKIDIDSRVNKYVNDHRVQGPIVFPGAGQIEIALSAAIASFGDCFSFIEDFHLISPIFLPDKGDPLQIQLEISSNEGNFAFYSKKANSDGSWKKHSYGKLNHKGDIFFPKEVDFMQIKDQCQAVPLSVEEVYEQYKEYGLQLGPIFQGNKEFTGNKNEAYGEIKIHDGILHETGFFNIHPAIIDACFQLSYAPLYFNNAGNERVGTYLPWNIKRIKFYQKPNHLKLFGYLQIEKFEIRKGYIANGWLLDENNNIILEIQGLETKYLQGSSGESNKQTNDFLYDWQWVESEKGFSGPIGPNAFNENTDKQTWLIFADNTGVAPKISDMFKDSYLNIILVDKGDAFEKKGSFSYQLGPNKEDEYRLLLDDIIEEDLTINHVLYLWPIDEANPKEIGTAPGREVMSGCVHVLHMIKQLSLLEQNLNLWIITSGTEIVGQDTTNNSVLLNNSSIWGIGRTIKNEYPLIQTKLVDLSAIIRDDEITGLLNVILSGSNNNEIAIRSNKLYTHKLEKDQSELLNKEHLKLVSPIGSNYHLEISAYGILDNLQLRETYRGKPGKGQIEVEVHATGLNFKDVVLAMGLLSDEAIKGGMNVDRKFGMECSGVVSSVGEGVGEFKIGDEVVIVAVDCLSGYTINSVEAAVHKPANLTHEQACSIPVVYLTAYHSLINLGRIQKGETVLIHSGAGGVGIAAIKLAQLRGCNVIATAGDEYKIEYLKSLGVEHIFSSRSLNFRDNVMRVTNNRGVDLVLNSLSGMAITQSFNCLAPFGRFIEIGKVDIYNNMKVGLRFFGDNISYFVVDLDRFIAQKPQLVKEVFKDVIKLFEDKVLDVHPIIEFPMSQVKDAFKFLAQGKNIGKVVISKNEPEVLVAPPSKIRFDNEGTYLITGGCGGFGLSVARWMSQRGAKNLVLMGRSGIKDAFSAEIVESMQNAGVNVTVFTGDITKINDVGNVIQLIEENMPPLKGIIHSAMVLQDSLIANLDEDKLLNVLEPKIMGAWNLHEATIGSKLDFFVMFSSISAVYGNPGQANYASANIFLDRFTYYRRSMGLPSTTINWGALGETGVIARNKKLDTMLTNQGLNKFTLEQSLEVLENALLYQPAQTIAVNIDWHKFNNFFPALMASSEFKHLIPINRSGPAAESEVLQELSGLDETARKVVIEAKLKIAISNILGTQPDKINSDISLSRLGLDSLMATQLRNWIQKAFQIDYPLMKIMEGPSISNVSEQVCAMISIEPS